MLKLLIMHFSPNSCQPIPLQSKYSQHTVPNALNLCSYLNVRDQIPHPYRATGKTVVLYILIFKLLDSRQGQKLVLSISGYEQ
jgi:hypothetical protein